MLDDDLRAALALHGESDVGSAILAEVVDRPALAVLAFGDGAERFELFDGIGLVRDENRRIELIEDSGTGRRRQSFLPRVIDFAEIDAPLEDRQKAAVPRLIGCDDDL